MKDKSTTSLQYSQHLTAAMIPQDNGITFFGNPETLEVSWRANGSQKTFRNLPKKVYCKLANAFNANQAAKMELDELRNKDLTRLSFMKKVELYTFFMYGGCDGFPHKLRKILLEGSPLKPRPVQMITFIVEDHQRQVKTLKCELPTHF